MQKPWILFLLGLASFFLGPLTGIPGIVIGRRMENRTGLAAFGYYCCWVITMLFVIAFVTGFLFGLTHPFWKAHI